MTQYPPQTPQSQPEYFTQHNFANNGIYQQNAIKPSTANNTVFTLFITIISLAIISFILMLMDIQYPHFISDIAMRIFLVMDACILALSITLMVLNRRKCPGRSRLRFWLGFSGLLSIAAVMLFIVSIVILLIVELSSGSGF